jgi:O-antigen ligase
MSPTLALCVFVVGIAGLFYLDRDNSVHTSKALWLPIIWLSIAGSRSPFAWFGMGTAAEIPGQLPEASLPDQLLAGSLMLLGLVVLILRRKEVASLLKASWPIVLYFSFCLFSLLWSDFPTWGFKRWARALGDLVMVLIVVTDAHPSVAFRRLVSRIGFVLLPVSVLLIRYYPAIGSGWDPWGQAQQFTGVTTNKNALGNLAYLIGLGALWQMLNLIRDKEQPNRRRHLLAQCTLLAFVIYLLNTAHCATATACFIFGVGLMLALSLPLFRRSPAAVHALVLAILLGGSVMSLLGGRAAVAEALGRKPDLTGRTEIWKILIPMAPNPVGGAGFETFWVGPRVAQAYALVGGLDRINEAHNGYIEVYLNLGVIGLGLIVVFLGQGYFKAVRFFRRDPALGALLVAYVASAVTYNITEAGFRMLHLEWFFLLLAVVAANRPLRPQEAASESGPEFAAAVRPLWETRLSPSPARTRAGAKTGLSADSANNLSQREEAPAAQLLVGEKRTVVRDSHRASGSPSTFGPSRGNAKHGRNS